MSNAPNHNGSGLEQQVSEIVPSHVKFIHDDDDDHDPEAGATTMEVVCRPYYRSNTCKP